MRKDNPIDHIIHQHLIKNDLSLEDYAYDLNKDPKTIKTLISGQGNPTIDTLVKVALSLDMPLFEFINLYNQTQAISITTLLNQLEAFFCESKYQEMQVTMDALSSIVSKVSTAEAVIIEKNILFYNGLLQARYGNLLESRILLKESMRVDASHKKNEKAEISSFLDYRSALNYAFVWGMESDLEYAISLISSIEKRYENHVYHHCMKLLNLSNFLFALEQYKKSLEYAKLGIVWSLRYGRSDYLDHFFFRKGIAEYRLGIKEYKNSLKKILELRQYDFVSSDNQMLVSRLKTVYKIDY